MPHENKEWIEESAAAVIGPVDNEERTIAKNGERRFVKGMDVMSTAQR
jgi:hypothetical protein